MENETVVPETPETPETELQKEVADHPAIEAQIESLEQRIAALEAKFNNPAVAHLFA